MIKAYVLTISDKGSRGERVDESGPAASELLKQKGIHTISIDIIPDDKDLIVERLLKLSLSSDLIITTGGTGLSTRDVTPEATMKVVQRLIPGIPELMRIEGFKYTNRACLTRGIAGIRDRCLIINLPGSSRAVKESLGIIIDIIPHAIEKINDSKEDCVSS